MTASGSDFVGRARERAQLEHAIDGVDAGGRALLVVGEPGIGKTALVEQAAVAARSRGRVIAALTGTAAESAIPYAGLHLMLSPFLGGLDQLATPQRSALEAVFGLSDAPQPPALLIGLATLSLLAEAGAQSPLLVIAEDLHFLDEATRTALLFVARRLAHEPIVMVMTTRPGAAVPPDDPSIERIPMQPLSFIEADRLLDRRRGGVTAAERRLLLDAAQGNPLALMELPPVHERPAVARPLTERLVDAFADRFAALSPAARLVAVVAALDDRPDPAEVTAAASAVVGEQVPATSVRELEASGLVTVSGRAVQFRHPLVRHAILHSATPGEWATAAGGLVTTLDRRRTVALRAHLATAPDESLAAELETLAAQRASAGDLSASASTLRRAADVSPDEAGRTRRLLFAAESAEQGGDYAEAAAILDALGEHDLAPAIRARAAWLAELLPNRGRVRLGGEIGPALQAVTDMRLAGEADRAMGALQFLATLAWGSSLDDTSGERILHTARAFGLPDDDPRMLVISALASPLTARDLTIPVRKPAEIAALDPELAWMFGYALTNSGRVEEAEAYMRRSLSALREQGQLQRLPHLLLSFAWNCYVRGDLAEGRSATDEAATIAVDTHDPIGVAAARDLSCVFRAADGERPDRDWITAGSAVAEAALETPAMRTTLVVAEGLAALSNGDDGEACAHLARILDPADPAYHPVFAAIVLPDAAVAAMRARRREVVERAVAHMSSDRFPRWQSPILDDALRIADLLMRADDDLEAAYDAVDVDALTGTFTRGKLELAIGMRQRRRKHVRLARPHLRAANALLTSSGAPGWAARARTELAATGEHVPETDAEATLAALTPQELRVAALAASGDSNREIAQRLYLSHRTVGAHLSSAYRKLGIASRAELASALG
ncbi:LuxR family transcriptional regulator [Microbacterium sp. BWT-B31]|uniref:AAA family ATPase n=1 Tax=Microbacterium sp. BWT-B31 TaxID=3232072 RepID=UPI0035289F3C